jgi:predicted peptidase
MAEKVFAGSVVKKVGYRYLLDLPQDYAQKPDWPLLVFLHGSGERGSDISTVSIYGPPLEIRKGRKIPMVVASPQCPDGEVWDPDAVVALVEHLCGTLKIDRRRILLTGLSMGGYGVWETGILRPDLFAALVPLCGGGGVRFLNVDRLKEVPVWCFHGARDEAVDVGESRKMVKLLDASGGKVRYTEYPDAAHNCWSRTYGDPKLYQWLLEQSRHPVAEKRRP